MVTKKMLQCSLLIFGFALSEADKQAEQRFPQKILVNKDILTGIQVGFAALAGLSAYALAPRMGWQIRQKNISHTPFYSMEPLYSMEPHKISYFFYLNPLWLPGLVLPRPAAGPLIQGLSSNYGRLSILNNLVGTAYAYGIGAHILPRLTPHIIPNDNFTKKLCLASAFLGTIADSNTRNNIYKLITGKFPQNKML